MRKFWNNENLPAKETNACYMQDEISLNMVWAVVPTAQNKFDFPFRSVGKDYDDQEKTMGSKQASITVSNKLCTQISTFLTLPRYHEAQTLPLNQRQ